MQKRFIIKITERRSLQTISLYYRENQYIQIYNKCSKSVFYTKAVSNLQKMSLLCAKKKKNQTLPFSYVIVVNILREMNKNVRQQLINVPYV